MKCLFIEPWHSDLQHRFTLNIDFSQDLIIVGYWLSEKNSERIRAQIQAHIRALRMKLLGNTLYLGKSIFIGYRSTDRVSTWTEVRFDFPTSSYASGTTFQKSRFSLVTGPPIGFWVKQSSDSDSPWSIAYYRLVPGAKVLLSCQDPKKEQVRS